MTVLRKLLTGVFLAATIAGAAVPAAAQATRDGGALLATGAKQLKGGNYQQAVRALTQSMRSDTLSAGQIAKALYLRGVAQRHLDRPAQAISDLTSAIWLQGLSKKELAQARLNRGLAYEAVGQNDLSRADLRRAREIDPNSRIADASPSTSPGAAVSAFDTRVETAVRKPKSPTTPGFQAEVTEERVARAAPAPEAIPSFQTQVQIAAREVDAKPALRSSIVPEDKKPQPPGSPSVANDKATAPAPASSEEKSKGFFGGIWDKATGGDDDEKPAPAPAAQEQKPPAANSQWTQTTKVDTTAPQANAPQPEEQADSKGVLGGLWDRARGRDTDEKPAAAPTVQSPAPPAANSQWTQTTKVDTTAPQANAQQPQEQADSKGVLGGLWDRARGRDTDEKPAAAPTVQSPAPPAANSQWTQTTKVDSTGRQANAQQPQEQADSKGVLGGLWDRARGRGNDNKPAASPTAQDQKPAATNNQQTQTTKVDSTGRQARAPLPPGQPAPAGGGRSYRIQLASVRSQGEADSTWQRLASKHTSLLAGRQPIIEKTEVGSLGTFYRIQIGPFTDKKESARLCNTLKSGGVDCFLVAR